MHCDDKRTIAALKQYISDATHELEDLTNQLGTEQDDAKKIEVQNRIKSLEGALSDFKDQLSAMI